MMHTHNIVHNNHTILTFALKCQVFFPQKLRASIRNKKIHYNNHCEKLQRFSISNKSTRKKSLIKILYINFLNPVIYFEKFKLRVDSSPCRAKIYSQDAEVPRPISPPIQIATANSQVVTTPPVLPSITK